MNSENIISTRRLITPQFYHSHAFPFLISRHRCEIRLRLIDRPLSIRENELSTRFEALGEASGDTAWNVLRAYLDIVEEHIAAIVRAHSPSFWFHLHRRLRPMLADFHDSKTDDTTVALVRRIAELAYAKHGDLERLDDLGSMGRVRLRTFLDGAWYDATALAMQSKLKAQKHFATMRRAQGVVMIDFCVDDLLNVFGVEGLCYEYWWAAASMRAIGKGSIAKWDRTRKPPLLYKDTAVNPLCFELYDERISKGMGFHTRLGTWLDRDGAGEKINATRGDQVHFAQLTPNPEVSAYPVWNRETQSIDEGLAATNFGIGTFSLTRFREENRFMAEPFQKKHGISLDAVLFAIWAASFFGIYTGITSHLLTLEKRLDRTMSNWSNVLFRGYTMVNFTPDTLAQEAKWWAKRLGHTYVPTFEEAQAGVTFISLNEEAQRHIGLWSSGKRPILIPSMHGLMIDLAAITPVLETLFFGVKKTQQRGGEAFEEAVRNALRARGLDICLQGELHWPDGNPREVDAGVRIGDRLILVECFSYEIPLDYERGKPSVFENRKGYIADKLEQARTLAERIKAQPKGTNFDVSWASSIDWRVVSPFVEFAWSLKEPLFDEAGAARLLQAKELIDFLTAGDPPAASFAGLIREMRDFPFEGIWY